MAGIDNLGPLNFFDKMKVLKIAATMPKAERALWDREEQIFNEKLTLDKQLGELYDSGASPEQISTLESKIAALDDEYWDL